MHYIGELLEDYILRSVILRTLNNKINRVYSQQVKSAQDFFEKSDLLSLASKKFDNVQEDYEQCCERLFEALQSLSVEEKKQVYDRISDFIKANNTELERLVALKTSMMKSLTDKKMSPLEQKDVLGEVSSLDVKIEKLSIVISSYEKITYYLKALITVKKEKLL